MSCFGVMRAPNTSNRGSIWCTCTWTPLEGSVDIRQGVNQLTNRQNNHHFNSSFPPWRATVHVWVLPSSNAGSNAGLACGPTRSRPLEEKIPKVCSGESCSRATRFLQGMSCSFPLSACSMFREYSSQKVMLMFTFCRFLGTACRALDPRGCLHLGHVVSDRYALSDIYSFMPFSVVGFEAEEGHSR